MAQTEQIGAQARRPSLITMLFFLSGFWLMLSPFLLDFAWNSAALWNAVVIGVALIALSLLRFGAPGHFEQVRWAALILGAWMIASPFIAEYFDVNAALWNAILVGALVIFGATSSAALPARRRA